MNSPRRVEGVLASGGSWAAEVPTEWNGTLCIYSSGYGESEGGPVESGGDPVTREMLLREGFAVAGTRTIGGGWVVGDAVQDQTAAVAEFAAQVGRPDRTIAWGRSMGGLIAASLAQTAPDVIDGAVAMCASVAGPVPMLNQGLDAAFVLSRLCFPDEDIPLVGSSMEDMARLHLGGRLVDRARSTTSGQARLALASAVAQLPAWTSNNLLAHRPDPPEPAAHDYRAALANQAAVFPFVAFSPRLDLEGRAGGNFSWNVGVDYAHQLAVSGSAHLVEAAYAEAGLSVETDLDALESAPRISAEGAAVEYMERNLTPDGYLGVPVLTMSLTGDFAPTVTQTSAYADVVAESGCGSLLEQIYVHAPGHCSSFSIAEVVTAIQAMDDRLRTGGWPDLAASALNGRARRTAESRWPKLKPPRFVEFSPGPFVRPYPRAERRAPLTRGPGQRVV